MYDIQISINARTSNYCSFFIMIKIDEPAITNLKSLLLNTDWSYLKNTSENLQFDALVEKITEYLDICAPLTI